MRAGQNYATTPGSTVWAFTPCHPTDPDPAHNNEAWNLAANGSIVEIMSGLWCVLCGAMRHGV